MDIRLFRKPADSSITIDISNYIISISGLEWRRKRDYTSVIPHPKITVTENIDIDIDDHVYFEFNGYIRLKTYVSSIKYNMGKKTKTLQLYDLVKQLENYYIGDFSPLDWSGYIPSNSEYYYDDDYAYRYYIQAIFLIKVMLHKAFGISINNVNMSPIENIDSQYKYKKDGVIYDLNMSELYFYFPQLLSIGKSNASDENNKTVDMLQIFLFLLSLLRIRYEYNEGYILFSPYFYGNEEEIVISDNLIFNYKKKNQTGYNSISGKLERLPTDALGLYCLDNWITEPIIEEYNKSNEDQLPQKNYTLFPHFELHRVGDENNIVPFDPYDTFYGDPYRTFLEQFVDLQYTVLFGSREKISINTNISYLREGILDKMNIKDRSSDIEYLVEI